MNKLLLIPTLVLSAQAAFAQAPAATDPSASKTRAEVKAETRTSKPPVTGNLEVQPPPSTKGSGLARSEVKAEERASGSLGTKNLEVATPTGKPPKAKSEKEKAAK